MVYLRTDFSKNFMRVLASGDSVIIFVFLWGTRGDPLRALPFCCLFTPLNRRVQSGGSQGTLRKCESKTLLDGPTTGPNQDRASALER